MPSRHVVSSDNDVPRLWLRHPLLSLCRHLWTFPIVLLRLVDPNVVPLPFDWLYSYIQQLPRYHCIAPVQTDLELLSLLGQYRVFGTVELNVLYS
jgi:hypothetical protein